MIGKSIQTRLFSAVFLVIFMITFGVGITFFLSSRWYVQYTARKETEHLIRMVQSESDRLSTDPAYTSSDSKENTRESSKALLRSVRLQLRDQPYNGIFLIFNSKQKLVFPKSSNDRNIYPISALEEQCRRMIQSGELISGKTSRILLSEDFWYISMCFRPVHLYGQSILFLLSKFRIHLFSGIIHGNCILRFYSLLCFYHLF